MKHLVIFSGAGISAESGINTFRDSDGLWEKYDINEVASIEGWYKNKALVLDFYNQRRKQVQKAQPNSAHLILTELEKHFNVSIITQNIDNLHEKAGSTNVLHLHGEINKACNEDKTQVIEIGDKEIYIGDKAPDGSQLRPFIVWFGEQVPLMDKAIETVHTADILLIVGTSLNVQPAASLINYVTKDTPVFLIDSKPQPTYRKVTVIPTKASVGMKLFREFLLEEKPLPANEYEQPKETDEVLLACNQAIDSDPANPEHWIQKSQRLRELQRYDEAMICQEKAMELLKNG
jgi:NAD-dependent deacetylase